MILVYVNEAIWLVGWIQLIAQLARPRTGHSCCPVLKNGWERFTVSLYTMHFRFYFPPYRRSTCEEYSGDGISTGNGSSETYSPIEAVSDAENTSRIIVIGSEEYHYQKKSDLQESIDHILPYLLDPPTSPGKPE